MQLLDRKPDALKRRHLRNCVAVKCDCNEELLWAVRGGNIVQCPRCKRTEELPVDTATPLDAHGPLVPQGSHQNRA